MQFCKQLQQHHLVVADTPPRCGNGLAEQIAAEELKTGREAGLELLSSLQVAGQQVEAVVTQLILEPQRLIQPQPGNVETGHMNQFEQLGGGVATGSQATDGQAVALPGQAPHRIDQLDFCLCLPGNVDDVVRSGELGQILNQHIGREPQDSRYHAAGGALTGVAVAGHQLGVESGEAAEVIFGLVRRFPAEVVGDNVPIAGVHGMKSQERGGVVCRAVTGCSGKSSLGRIHARAVLQFWAGRLDGKRRP